MSNIIRDHDIGNENDIQYKTNETIQNKTKSNICSLIPAVYICTVDVKDGEEKMSSKRHIQMKRFINRLNIPNNKVHWNIVPRMHKGTQQLSSTDNHLLAMKDALKHNYDYVLIFEDDLYLRNEDSNFQIDKCIPALNDFLHFWDNTKNNDIIYLGHIAWKLGKRVSGKEQYCIVESLGQCIHAYIINKNMMKFLTSFTCEEIIDISKKHWTSGSCGYALDTFITIQIRNKKCRSFAFYPQFIMQDSIKGYDEWSKTLEYVCWTFGSLEGFFTIMCGVVLLCIVEGIFSRKDCKPGRTIYRYILFYLLMYFIDICVRIRNK